MLLRVIVWSYFAFATLLIYAKLWWAVIKHEGDREALERLRTPVVARMIEVLLENYQFYPVEVVLELIIEVSLFAMGVLHCCY